MNGGGIDAVEVVLTGVRKLIKLGRALIVPSGAP